MPDPNPLSLIVILVLSASLAYRSSFLKNRRLFRISLLQILYLVIVPGVVFTLLFNYLQSFRSLPSAGSQLIPDSVLILTNLLATLFTYGGVAIHTATKVLSDTSLRYDDSDASELNRYFHLTFSHNLIYSGSIFIVTSLVLLELNHISSFEYGRWISPIFRGVLIGASFALSMYHYTRSHDDYSGRWADLKATFIVGWLAVVIIFYGIIKLDAPLREYQLLLPMLLGLSSINVLNIALLVRHVKIKRSLKRQLVQNPPPNSL